MAVPIVLPVLPAAEVAWTYKTNPTPGETVGWPQFVQTVDGVRESLPPTQRASAVIFPADYGEAAAINELGRGTGLPAAVSGQNSEWWWGPGNPHATTIVAVMPGPADVTGSGAYRYLAQFFTSVRVAATLSNPYGSTTRNGAATSTSAPALASRGPGYGPSCATTADNRAPQSRNPRLRRAGRAAVVRRPGLRAGPSPSQHDRAHPDTTHVRPGQLRSIVR